MKSEQTFSAQQQQHCKRPRNENKQNRPSDNGARRSALSVAVFCEFFGESTPRLFSTLFVRITGFFGTFRLIVV